MAPPGGCPGPLRKEEGTILYAERILGGHRLGGGAALCGQRDAPWLQGREPGGNGAGTAAGRRVPLGRYLTKHPYVLRHPTARIIANQAAALKGALGWS